MPPLRERFEDIPTSPLRQRVQVLFDEIQIAIYNDDRESVDQLMMKLALATTNQGRTN